jgi:DNA-binding NtrC family response regulator
MIGEALVRQDVLPMNLLGVDDEQYVRQLCADVAKQSGMKVTTVSTSEEAISILENSAVDILITDLKLPKSSGLDLLQRVHDQHREVAVIVLTQYGSIDSAVAARAIFLCWSSPFLTNFPGCTVLQKPLLTRLCGSY